MMVKIFTVILTALLSISSFAQQIGDTQTGQLNYYNDIYHGRPTSSGEIYDKTKVSAAHKSLPMKTMVEVENLENNKSIFVEINDRTPEGSEAILELSRAAAEQLDFVHDGITNGKIRIIQVLQPVNKSVANPEQALKKNSPKIVKNKINKPKQIVKKTEPKPAPTLNNQTINTNSIKEQKSEEEILLEDAIKNGDKKYAIQLGAFKEKSSLNSALKLAKDNGIYLKKDLFIITSNTETGELYKLIYGYFGEDHANKKIKEVKNIFIDSFIKKF